MRVDYDHMVFYQLFIMVHGQPWLQSKLLFFLTKWVHHIVKLLCFCGKLQEYDNISAL